jgi:hypothetical protein
VNRGARRGVEWSSHSRNHQERFMNDKQKVSRRTVLMVLAGAACTGLASGRTAWAQQKASKEAMKYQDRPNGEQKCSNCLQFVAPDGCKVVDGKISPEGWCIAYAKKT